MNSYMKQTGIVSLRGVNFGFWSLLGCSGQSANILSCQGLFWGSAKKHDAFKNYFYIKAFDDYVFISLKLITCRICDFLSSLF